jgi:hypothetical protein
MNDPVGQRPKNVGSSYSKNGFTNESIIEHTYCPENLPYPLFACLKTGKGYQRGEYLPFVKGGEEGFIPMSK